MSLDHLLDNLWQEYTGRNPHALKIYQLFTARGETVINDHIAFRTFNNATVNIEQLAKWFKNYGYIEKGSYNFPVKKLIAKHYEHEDEKLPKVFISELLTEKFSPQLQTIINQCIVKMTANPIVNSETMLYSGNCWGPISYSTYKALLTESEYAAWMYVFGFCANHFTVLVNELKTFNNLEDVNSFLLGNKFELNTSGGLIKGTPDVFLEQSSTLAEKRRVNFIEGTYEIPSCYYEFAKRYPLTNGKLYSGFIADSADKIFESTNVST